MKNKFPKSSKLNTTLSALNITGGSETPPNTFVNVHDLSSL